MFLGNIVGESESHTIALIAAKEIDQGVEMYNLYVLSVVFIINEAQKSRLLNSLQSLLLAVACLAGSYLSAYLVCFSFAVEIQRRTSSEVKDVERGERIF